jgi:hypothetical protein
MTKCILRYLFVNMCLLALAACGGGDGTAVQPTVYTTAVLKIELSGVLPADVAIAGAGFTLTLPASTTPALTDGAVANGVVAPSGTFAGGTQLPPVYTAATTSTPGAVRIARASSSDAGVTQTGEVATVTLQLSNGAVPTAESFTLDSSAVEVIDTKGNPVSGMQAVISSVQLQ